MSETTRQFEKRKQEHIHLALMQDNQAIEMSALNNIHLLHEALPDLDFSDIQIHTKRFGKNQLKPFLISSMTAGHKDAAKINSNLMSACAKTSWAMGVGSQRREITDKNAAFEWTSLRKEFPEVELYSNIGIAQLITSSVSDIQRVLNSLNANALIIHLNPLQECIQPEGTPQFKGAWKAIEAICKQISIPVILKETGCGFSQSTLERIKGIGISAVDVSGLGGTHWGRIEGHRASDNFERQRASKTFANWGIDTVSSILNAKRISPDFEIWGSGGVRNGMDAAKLLALGANTVGFAKPMLEASLVSDDKVLQLMDTIEYELKVALFCTGSASIKELQEKPYETRR